MADLVAKETEINEALEVMKVDVEQLTEFIKESETLTK